MVRRFPFEHNKQTSDRAMFEHWRKQTDLAPELSIGGPTMGWVNAALKETTFIAQMSLPQHIPCHVFYGDEDQIVDVAEIPKRMKLWSGGTLGRRPINRDVIQDMKFGRFHVVEFLAHRGTVQQNQAFAAE